MSTPDNSLGTPNNLFGDAAAATRALIDADNAAPSPNVADNQTTPQVDTSQGRTPEAGTAPVAPTPLSWDQIDLSVLPEDQRKYVEEGYLRQSDYTRKTQELAEQRKQIEQFGDIETVRASVEFAQNLQDPDFLRQLNADIQAHLDSLSPGGQAPLPQSAPSPAQSTVPQTTGLDPAIQRQIEELTQFKANFEHTQHEAELVDQMTDRLQQAEDSIRATYPSYTQADIDKIYELSPAHGFDLFAAQENYEAMRQHFTQSLIGNKGNHPNVANNVRSDTLVTQPHEMNTLEAAKKASAALFAQG